VRIIIQTFSEDLRDLKRAARQWPFVSNG